MTGPKNTLFRAHFSRLAGPSSILSEQRNLEEGTMFALALIPFAALWVADNQDFLSNVTDAPWEYVGVVERDAGTQPTGAVSVPLSTEAQSYILFKQMPKEVPTAGNVADNGGYQSVSVWLPEDGR
jgi:hypothetical protein